MPRRDQKSKSEGWALESTAKTEPQPQRQTKAAQLARMLATKRGADVAAISAKFGWQAHSTRAALTGLRKAGYTVVREVSVNGCSTRYRIVAAVAAGGDENEPQNAG